MGNILNLPCLRGIIGDWTYFSTVMKISDITKRVLTVSESNELYTTNINEILQREINKKRIDQIKDYILYNPEHFFSCIIAAIHKGNPIWSDFDIESHFKVDNKVISENEIEFIENKVGILSLTGDEIIFALDGQHRLKGLKEAYSLDENIGKEEIPIIIVVHNALKKQRTRRLFTVLNKYAQKPKEAELIILDEDDAAALITRKLVETHYVLSHKNAVSSSNISNIPANDNKSFTTLVTINRINKFLLSNYYKIDFTKRPSDDQLSKYLSVCLEFWDFLFKVNPWIMKYLEGEDVCFENGDSYRRNSISGGNILLRPIGQRIFAKIFVKSQESIGIPQLTKQLSKIDFNLNGPLCKYITWYDKIIPKSESLQKRVFFQFLGLSHDDNLFEDIKRQYDKYGIMNFQSMLSLINK